MIERITEFMSYDMIVAMCCFVVAHIFAWYTHNAQFAWEYWSNRPVLANIIFGVPAEETSRIQELHILVGHLMCAVIDEVF